ncbi:hypothetical protein GQ457_01G013520 [Hibiscus cannabinus]
MPDNNMLGQDSTMFSTLKFSFELMTEPRNLCSLSPSTPNAHLGLKFRGYFNILCEGPRAISLMGYWIPDEKCGRLNEEKTRFEA